MRVRLRRRSPRRKARLSPVDDWKTTALPRIKTALAAKDQDALSSLMAHLALEGRPTEEVQHLAEMLLRQQPHDVQEWWAGDCNCDGHQN